MHSIENKIVVIMRGGVAMCDTNNVLAHPRTLAIPIRIFPAPMCFTSTYCSYCTRVSLARASMIVELLLLATSSL
jgi:hypothetical protein